MIDCKVENFMDKRRIYEIDQDELKKEYNKYKSSIPFIRDSYVESDREEEGEIFFSDNTNNEKYLMDYISKVSNEIDERFAKTYLPKPYLYLSKVDNVSKYLSISQPFKPASPKIFISHSHKDLKLVIQFAERLYEKFKLNSFIDSKFWPYFNNIIENNVKRIYISEQGNGQNIWNISKCVRDIIDIYLLEALQLQLLNSEVIIIIKTNNYSYKSPWIRFENNVIDYICKNENCNIQHISVRNLMNQRSL